MSQAWQLLHPTVQRKLWDMKWTELRPIQVDAIEHLLGGTPTDCIIESPTASGKTEAAFLPVLSAIADDPFGGVRAMYIGPLKALINDQFGRIEQLCERMEMPVCRWHGDVDDGPRKALLARPAGILLITPESLEAMFVLRPTQMRSLFGRLAYVVIDEMHAFLESERGAQLISQLHRLRVRAGTDPLRLGLSATLGDPAAACRWLRRDGRPVRHIQSKGSGAEIRLKLRGYWRREAKTDGDETDPTLPEVARAILVACHGKTNLVFANSKGLIEAAADELATQARAMSLPDEIVVHHGSLSKEQREYAEERLRSGRPCTAVCSNTLELGIDIGAIDEVVQISSPWSVASLVQRLGRSGRRPGSARILRGYFVEDYPTGDATRWDRLHLDFIRGLAMIELLLEGWIERPSPERAHLSTMVQQVLSSIAETGGILARDLYKRINESGAFVGIGTTQFASLLRELGARDLIEQMPEGTLVLGMKGEKIVEHYSFYAAFKAATEFQVVYRDRTIGTLPESMLPGEGDFVILAARRWLVEQIDVEAQKVLVSPSRGRRPPRFASGQADLDSNVHARMRALLCGDHVPSYADETALEMLRNARAEARASELDTSARTLEDRSIVQLWAGTRIHRTLFLVFAVAGVRVQPAADVALEVVAPREIWIAVLRRFLDAPDGDALARFAEERLYARVTDGEKFDVFLPSELWRASYVRERLDIPGSLRVVARLLDVTVEGSSTREPTAAARAVAITSLASWADQIVALEARPILPARVALVPSEAHAHALRVELATRAPHALAGTRFFTAAAAARAILDAAGIDYALGEENLRPLRLRKVFREAPRLVGYRTGELDTPGWEAAFASTIEQLEAAGLRPDDLASVANERVKDLVTIWRAVDADAKDSWTVSRLLYEAMRALRGNAALWPFDAPVLAAVALAVDTAHAQLLREIPRLTLGMLAGRPARKRAIERMSALLGAEAAEQIARPTPPDGREGELAILGELLFEAPEQLASTARRRSSGPDGTVTLELFAGVDEEIEATVRWVAEEVFDRGTSVQDIAILVPASDPLATLVADRVGALAWPSGTMPVYLAAGRPATSTAAGARLLALLRAVYAFLPASAVLELLPRLRLVGREGHLTPGEARDVVGTLARTGGSSARPDGALGWREGLARHSNEPAVVAMRPALEALLDIIDAVLAADGVADLWERVRAYVATHVIFAEGLDELVEQLGGDVLGLAQDPVTASVVGLRVIELLIERLNAQRIHEGRFGDPAIFVGTIASAAALRFTAVRVIGLAEGAFPGTLREDAILPAELRRQLPAFSITSDDDYLTGRLHALDQVVRGVTERLVLSAPRTDLNGSEREPASIFVEVAAAIARPNPNTGDRARVIPTLADLDRDGFLPARTAANLRRIAAPLLPSCWVYRVVGAGSELPSTWTASSPTNPISVRERERGFDGILTGEPFARSAWGASAEYPLSASSLRMLLACPQQFLLERVVGFSPRSDPPTGYRIDPFRYGREFHSVLMNFGRAHGTAFGAREDQLDRWLDVADNMAAAAFDLLAADYPFVSDGVVQAERRRFRRDVRAFIQHDWNGGRPRRFVDAERPFGPIAIATSNGSVYVKGVIDRIDVDEGLSLVRDLKTGRAQPRERDLRAPKPDLDLQIALYAEIARLLAAEWETPVDVAAGYVYVDRFATERERAFRDDRHALHVAGRRWFDLAHALLREQLYVKSPDPDQCSRCSFAAVCGDETVATAAGLEHAAGALAAFRDLER